MENKIKINLFGCVRLTNGSESIDEGTIHSGRLLTLLSYLIIHRDSPVLNKVLCEQFIGEEYKNPEGTLKNLMYRLRGVLRQLGPEEYICTTSGSYRWNQDIPVETDYERFEQLYEQILAEDDPQRKEDLCTEAVACYNGNFSSGIAEERWIVAKYVQYQTQYTEIVNQLSTMYEEKQEWGQLEQLCRDALTTEPFVEDIHSCLIKSLQYQKKYTQAMTHYDEAKKLFYENFGIWDPKKLQESISEFPKERSSGEVSLAEIEKEAQSGQVSAGAFLCDSQTFQQIYRFEMQRVSRLGISDFLLLFTLRRQGNLWNRTVVDLGLTHAIGLLEKLVCKTLRIGDVITQITQTQYVILLSSCSYEAGVEIAKRIYKEFRRKTKRQKLELNYELREISSPWQEMGGVIGE